MKSIKEVEKIADSEISRLNIWSQPAHMTLSTIYNLIYELFFSEDADNLTHRFKAEKIMSYLPGVAPYITKCDDSIVKIDAERSIRFSEEMNFDITKVIEYGQFCTIMERVHKGDFSEEVSEDRVFLNFAGKEAFQAEAQDVLISELSLPNFVSPKQVFNLKYAFSLGSGETHFEPRNVAEQVRAQRLELEKLDNDIEYVKDFSNVIEGLADGDYRALKFSAMAFALFIRSVSRILQEAIQRGLLSGSKANSQLIFWKAPCLRRRDLVDVLAKAASVEKESARVFVENFSLTIGTDCPVWVRNGYFPPFQNLGDRVVFSPAVLLVMLSNRNSIFVCSKKNDTTFHNIVSKGMEPKLVDDFLTELPPGGDWEVSRSVNFPGGEIDLVLFHSELNIVLQIQAKGSIAPEGAVLVRNFESRCEEGVRQLRRFEALPQEVKISILKSKFPLVDFGTLIVPCLLARGSFGRPSFLLSNEDILFINPFLARKAFANGGFDWKNPIEAIASVKAELIKSVDCVASREKFSVFEYEFDVEMPVWDRNKLNEAKMSAARSFRKRS